MKSSDLLPIVYKEIVLKKSTIEALIKSKWIICVCLNTKDSLLSFYITNCVISICCDKIYTVSTDLKLFYIYTRTGLHKLVKTNMQKT